MKANARLAALNEQAVKGSRRNLYENLVTRRIRARYSQSEEIAILRKTIAGIDGAREEFETFHAFAEQCKAEVRAELEME